MHVCPVSIQIRQRWWLRHYVAAVSLGCRLTGRAPDMERVGWWVQRGLVVWIVPVRAEVAA
ncbi:hypothetical protein [[Pseudomonas] boreopolis]|uniref:Uncharacterized protein n=1 Tax=Xanthomonas boreopolis TaxID=86183 RepID=A0A919F7J7_9XANT|nr:hypothetical protein GCM10009090_16500 [[Pseudomonas] boreopolis]